MIWKHNWICTCGKKKIVTLDDTSSEDLYSLFCDCWHDDPPVTGEELLKYVISAERWDFLTEISLEDLIRLAYSRSIREVSKLTGTSFLQKDREHCAPEQLEQLRKIAVFKDKLNVENYDQCIELCVSAVFEICRRNDAELLRIYLDEFNGYYPVEIYDAVFDYYIYMYLPEWDLLRQFNEYNGCPSGDYPGIRNKENKYVAPEIQRNLLDILILQAEKCKAPHPEVLEILFAHGISSCREVFPIIEQSMHFGIAFSNRDSEETQYAERILLNYDDQELAQENCINPFELDKLLAQTNFGTPVTCTCGDERCGGIIACSESWIIGKKLRLYIPEKGNMYFFEIVDRFAFRQEFLLTLKQVIQTLQYHKKWQKTGSTSTDDETLFLPYGTSLAALQKLSKDIADDLSKS